MARQSHSGQRNTRSLSNGHGNNRQADGNPRAPIEELVQKAVPRVFVVLVVADELQLLEQVFVQRAHVRERLRVDQVRDAGGNGPRDRHPPRRFTPQRVQLLEVRAGIQLGILGARNHQRRDRQVGIGTEGDLGKTLNEMVGYHI